jgi:hypothetical protein
VDRTITVLFGINVTLLEVSFVLLRTNISYVFGNKEIKIEENSN